MNRIDLRDVSLLIVPAIIVVVIVLAIILLNIQFSDFQNAYAGEVEKETRQNNAMLMRALQDILESKQLDKMHRLLASGKGSNPMIVKIIARGRGAVMETPGAPQYLSEHIREPEIKGFFKQNHDENVLIKFDRSLESYMIYHSIRFKANNQDYVLVMASKCNSMTLLMRQTRRMVWSLAAIGIVATLLLTAYFFQRIRLPLNRLFASTSRIAAGELDNPVYIPRHGLIREIALCLQSLTEQLKKQIISLRDGTNERETMLNALTEAILLLDADGRVVRWNHSAETLFFPGKSADETNPPDCPPQLREYIVRTDNPGIHAEKIHFQRGRREYILLVNAATFMRDGHRFLLISATDITEISRLETSHREFIAAISHEMKTPLTGIVGAVDAIRGGALDNVEYKERCIATLASQSERLNTLLLNFLTLASLDEENPVKLHNFMPVFPLSLLRAVEEVCRSSAEAAGIDIAITECDSAEFRGDVQLLQQALDNLVINAVIHSGTQRIELAAVRNLQLNCIDLIVKDYGCGIPPEHQDRVFNRFYRVPTGNRRKNGSGIGLTIVKRVALYHRGTVVLNSEAGRGSEFHLRLPL